MSTVHVTFWDPVTASPIGDAEVAIGPQTPVSAISAALPPPYRGADLHLGSQLIPGEVTFARSPITSGSLLSVGGPGPSPFDPHGLAGVLRVLDGPDAGQVFPLGPGLHDIARRAEASVTLTDQEVTRRGHTRLTMDAAGAVTVEDLGSANGTWIDDERVPPQVGALAGVAVPLPAGARLRVGTSVLAWSPAPAGRRTVTRSTDGVLHFDRSFGAVPVVTPIRLQLPITNEAPRSVWSLLVPLLLPVVAGVVMAVLAHQPLFLVFAVLGPVGALGSHLVDRAQRRRRQAGLAQRRDGVAAEVRQHVGVETTLRNERSPGPAEALMAATGMSDRLWPRGAADPDALLLRVGRATQPAAVTLDGETWPGLEPAVVIDAPLTVDLRAAGVLGVTGGPAQTAELTRWLIVQLATLRSPADLRLVVLSAGAGAELEWTRWLPHLSAGPQGTVPARTGTTPATRLRRVTELQELVARRQSSSEAWDGDVVVVLDGALELRATPGMKEVLRDGPAAGVYTIAADSGSMNEAGAQCWFEPDGVLHVTPSRAETSLAAEPDRCPLAVAELVARSIAPLRDRLAPSSGGAPIPHPVRFLDLLGIPGAPSADDVRARWAASAGPVTRVPIGADAHGPVLIDLAEQGPHAMLGGATGAGKSYLLQALVTSLLMANGPDRLNLVLVDFKGGSAFLPFERCPHVVALIRSTGATPAEVFDDAAARRLLASVRAEVQRRESILAPFGGEIDEYWRVRSARSEGPDLPALPRLVFVLDEFARVLETAPGFPRELVNVAAKGRALGMHLVLATQSLQGKLSPELKNAIDLRITLRQNEPADSTEVLGSPAAAAIPARLRGRGLILSTRDDARVPRPFQAGFLGAPPPQSGPAPAVVCTLPWDELGSDRPITTPVVNDDPTDQDLCIVAIESAGAGLKAPSRPLLPPLPAVLNRSELAAAVTTSTVVVGLADDPAHQAQPPVGLDLAGTERLLVAGGSQQGRSTFARTLIDGITERFGPGRAHLYIVEREPSGLSAFERLAHCGGVITAAQPDRLRRLAQWLSQETTRRRSLENEDWRHEPKIVVIVDGWELIENRSDPAHLETSVTTSMRDVATSGVTAGIHVVAIGGLDMLNGRHAGLFDRRLVLSFPKAESRQQHLPPGTPAAPVLPGRAVDASTGWAVQLAVPARDDEEIIRASHDPQVITDGPPPVAVPALPQRVPITELKPEGPSSRWVPLGIGGHPAGTAGIDLFGGGPSTLLISGPRGAGRSTAVRTVLHGLQELSIPVVLVAAGQSPLQEIPPIEGRLEILTGTALTDADLRAAAERLNATEYAVLVDDCHDLTVEPSTRAYAEQPTLIAELCGPSAPGQGRRVLVMAGDASLVLNGQRRSLGRPVQEMVQTGHRLLLTPARPADAREQGFSLEADQFFTGPPGRGYLGSGHTVTLIQVADGTPYVVSWPSTRTA